MSVKKAARVAWQLLVVDQPCHPVPICVGGNVAAVTIAIVTIRDIYYHPIIFNVGTRTAIGAHRHVDQCGSASQQPCAAGSARRSSDPDVERSSRVWHQSR